MERSYEKTLKPGIVPRHGILAGVIRHLLSGTRCLEMECWDGNWWAQGPRVTHRWPGGFHAFPPCESVAFGAVVAAIAEHAFTSSPLPVILSIDLHL